CETFVTQKNIEKKIKEAPLCSSCQRPTQFVSEKTYFFRLSVYQEKLLQFYRDNPDFIVPKERFNEVIRFVEAGLRDLSISRTTVQWGIPFPDDPTHTIYVWVEALCNYITAIGYGDPKKQIEFNRWWPANLHIIGKDIIRFHAIYWPAFLMAANLAPPKQILVHGWIKVNKQKMSKSLGNVIDPVFLYDAYGPEPVRYFLLRQVPVNQDGEFSTGDLEHCIEADLANDLGNLLQRMAALAQKYKIVELEAPKIWSEQSIHLRDESLNMIEDFNNYMQNYVFHVALARLWQFIKQVNSYFHAQEPWKLALNNKKKFLEVLAATCHSLRTIAILLWPVMPHKMEQLLSSLGISFQLENDTIKKWALGTWNKQFKIKKIAPLFKKPI
ncbi:MAG: methionine--tRNA ligase, partial [Candidatus Babeliales bacterium]